MMTKKATAVARMTSNKIVQKQPQRNLGLFYLDRGVTVFMTINECITQLADYALERGLIAPGDRVYTVNRLLEILELDTFAEEKGQPRPLCEILQGFCDYAVEKGFLEDSPVYRDLFDTKIMGAVVPRPSEVSRKFFRLYRESPQKATDYFYKLSQNSNYIRTDRISKDKKWTVDTQYGTLDVTINLSKPEKDPKAIAAARNLAQSSYPRCALCRENEGYAGRVNAPARQNHRIIPITLNQTPWGLQYSPYVYYNEHCIAFNFEHTPMKIERATFVKLLDFVKLFPHYFLGSNADLPIVGGSILSHDHFQGGRYEFAMARAPMEKQFRIKGFEQVEVGIVHWPMSVIRLRCDNTSMLVDLADRFLKAWRSYSDPDAFIFAQTDGTEHNTITPIARKKGDLFELDLVLRNNITTEEHPLGLYHPHAELHHIKKENIGLIEVMGLAVLPARLEHELTRLAAAMLSKADFRNDEELSKHADWAEDIMKRYPHLDESNIAEVLGKEVGLVFEKVLECAGVYKCTPSGRAAFERFIGTLNQ